MGLSPDITLILTSFSLNHLIVSIASSLTLSEIIIKDKKEEKIKLINMDERIKKLNQSREQRNAHGSTHVYGVAQFVTKMLNTLQCNPELTLKDNVALLPEKIVVKDNPSELIISHIDVLYNIQHILFCKNVFIFLHTFLIITLFFI